MKIFWAVALGAAVGGVSRYYFTVSVQPRLGALPWSTMLINISGSLLLGFIMSYALATPSMSLEVRALLTTGFCGGFTTFSTYSYETARLLEDGEYQHAAMYALGSVVLSLAATFAGFMLARGIMTMRARG
ncbi:MAG: fluoride efflux transporter CrcB [bacterium]